MKDKENEEIEIIKKTKLGRKRKKKRQISISGQVMTLKIRI